MARRRKNWDGTPPQRTYPYAVETVNHLWHEPGVSVWPGNDEGYVTSDWSWSQPTRVIIFRQLVKSGDWHPYSNPNGTPSTYREIHRIPVPDDIMASSQATAYSWVRNQILTWVRGTYGADVFDESRRS